MKVAPVIDPDGFRPNVGMALPSPLLPSVSSCHHDALDMALSNALKEPSSEEKRVRLAIFDLDNTLLAGDSDHSWGEFLVEQGAVDAERW